MHFRPDATLDDARRVCNAARVSPPLDFGAFAAAMAVVHDDHQAPASLFAQVDAAGAGAVPPEKARRRPPAAARRVTAA